MTKVNYYLRKCPLLIRFSSSSKGNAQPWVAADGAAWGRVLETASLDAGEETPRLQLYRGSVRGVSIGVGDRVGGKIVIRGDLGGRLGRIAGMADMLNRGVRRVATRTGVDRLASPAWTRLGRTGIVSGRGGGAWKLLDLTGIVGGRVGGAWKRLDWTGIVSRKGTGAVRWSCNARAPRTLRDSPVWVGGVGESLARGSRCPPPDQTARGSRWASGLIVGGGWAG